MLPTLPSLIQLSHSILYLPCMYIISFLASYRFHLPGIFLYSPLVLLFLIMIMLILPAFHREYILILQRHLCPTSVARDFTVVVGDVDELACLKAIIRLKRQRAIMVARA